MGKPKFSSENYSSNDVIHCDTEEKMWIVTHKLNFNWILKTPWEAYGNTCCINSCTETYGNKTFYLAHGYTVLEFDDFDWSEQPEVIHTEKTTAQTQYSTGAVRDDKEGKGRCDLLPLDVVEYLDHGKILSYIQSFKESGKIAFLYNAIEKFSPNFSNGKTANDVLGVNLAETLLELAKHFEQGAKHYGENNWQKGIPVSSYIDSAVRHYLKYRAGWTDERHDRAFVWNLVCCIWTMQHLPIMDDYTDKGDENENE